MDERKCKRIALAAGLFFLVCMSGVCLMIKTAQNGYEKTAGQMAALTEQVPEAESVFAGVLTGAYGQDSPEEADDRRNIEEGEKLLEKYGYDFRDSLRSGMWFPYAGSMALLLGGCCLICAWVVRYALQEKRKASDRADYLEEKLKEEKNRNQQMESALRREEQETKAMITDLSHQLKTPVASLKMSHEIEDSTKLSSEETKEFHEKEREDVRRLEDLLRAFTQMTRLETGMIRLHPERAGLKDTLAKTVAGAYVKALNKGIRIETEEFADIPVCHDSGWTAEAFGNVLDNGVKYAPPGTRIAIRVSEMVSFVMIEIEDEGPGIPLEERTKIFQRFYRGNSDMVRRAEGSGVGLYLTRRILERQGGTVCVKTGRNGGSVFVMTLPIE